MADGSLRIGSDIGLRNGLTRTNERTNEEIGSDRGSLAAVTRTGGREDFASIGEGIAAGLWPDGTRHEVIRHGERREISQAVRWAVWFGYTCPRHPTTTKCRAHGVLAKLLARESEDWITTHQVDPDAALSSAFCLHCWMPGLTDRPL